VKYSPLFGAIFRQKFEAALTLSAAHGWNENCTESPFQCSEWLMVLSLITKESIQRLVFLPLLSLMPKKVTKDKTAQRFWTALAGPEGVKPQVLQRHPGSLDSACAEPL